MMRRRKRRRRRRERDAAYLAHVRVAPAVRPQQDPSEEGSDTDQRGGVALLSITVDACGEEGQECSHDAESVSQTFAEVELL